MVDRNALPATDRYDVLVIGGGPSGHHAASTAATAGRRTLLIERDQAVGGSCVARGTIPSKTLRETALAVIGFRRRSGGVFAVAMREDLQVASLMNRLDEVVAAHQRFLSDQLSRSSIERAHGRARFLSPHLVEITGTRGRKRIVAGELIVIAAGSRPRTPPEVPVDHTHILDSDSILSLTYLPRSLAVLGAGVIASEYASIFSALGVTVTMVDKGERPLGFLDGELTSRFVTAFSAAGSRYVGKASAKTVVWDGEQVVTTLTTGEVLRTDKLLCALGRVANLDGLDIEAAGVKPTDRGLIPVDSQLRTVVPHILGVGDVIGPPALASSAMDQGRRAICHALGQDPGVPPELIPMGIYAIPEMSQVGLTEAEAIKRHGSCTVGRAPFSEIARGWISANQDGFLKLVADGAGRKLLGIQVIGEGAAELVSVGQMALIGGMDVATFVVNTYNFPTLSEAYRVAALDLQEKMRAAPVSISAA
ncbi:NAD(P)(+) transhydrogenase [Planctomycetota bacterium]|nr:NAD(P)(+) transhydrogenase [Planctomycetota bacterium]